jgi:hypothetical protein
MDQFVKISRFGFEKSAPHSPHPPQQPTSRHVELIHFEMKPKNGAQTLFSLSSIGPLCIPPPSNRLETRNTISAWNGGAQLKYRKIIIICFYLFILVKGSTFLPRVGAVKKFLGKNIEFIDSFTFQKPSLSIFWIFTQVRQICPTWPKLKICSKTSASATEFFEQKIAESNISATEFFEHFCEWICRAKKFCRFSVVTFSNLCAGACCYVCSLSSAPGIDFTKLHFGRNWLINFRPQFLAIFHPKNNIYLFLCVLCIYWKKSQILWYKKT